MALLLPAGRAFDGTRQVEEFGATDPVKFDLR
jgi:hypothetical protein